MQSLKLKLRAEYLILQVGIHFLKSLIPNMLKQK